LRSPDHPAPEYCEHATPNGMSVARMLAVRLTKRAIAVMLAGSLAWWTFKPLREVTFDMSTEESVPVQAITEPARLALDKAAFHVPLWMAPHTPPAPAPPPKPEPPPTPLKLQILAIIRAGDGGREAPDGGREHSGHGVRALLYDPDLDRTIWVQAGQIIGSRVVERITSDAVEFREGTLLRPLALREARIAGTALERALRGGGLP